MTRETMPERMAVVETRVDTIIQNQNRQDARLARIEEAVTSVTGGWRIIAAIAGVGATVGGAIVGWLAYLRG